MVDFTIILEFRGFLFLPNQTIGFPVPFQLLGIIGIGIFSGFFFIVHFDVGDAIANDQNDFENNWNGNLENFYALEKVNRAQNWRMWQGQYFTFIN